MFHAHATVRSPDDQHERALAALRRRWTNAARAGLILGTGSGGLADEISAEVTIPFGEVPGMPRSTALAHKGQFVCGKLGETPILAMQGRCHFYEGYSFDQVTLGIRLMHAAGARQLVITNAAGAVNPHFAVGDVVIVEDHINMMWKQTPSAGRSKIAPYDPDLAEETAAIARRENFIAHRGVYVGVTGPNYETRAEYRFFRRIGGDVVGMSTIPEAMVAKECGMRVLALSLVTNVARPDAPDRVDAEDVVDCARLAEPKLRAIIRGVLPCC